jgi:hypothetical protein
MGHEECQFPRNCQNQLLWKEIGNWVPYGKKSLFKRRHFSWLNFEMGLKINQKITNFSKGWRAGVIDIITAGRCTSRSTIAFVMKNWPKNHPKFLLWPAFNLIINSRSCFNWPFRSYLSWRTVLFLRVNTIHWIGNIKILMMDKKHRVTSGVWPIRYGWNPAYRWNSA